MSSPIGGFMPIPLAMMIPFMATQSLVMGDAFGKGFQYGKRKISAMSNEEFNELTEVTLASNMFKAYEKIIPDLQESIKNSDKLQSTVINTLLQLPFKIIEGVLEETHDNIMGKDHHDTVDTIHPDISEKEKAIIKENQAKNPPPKPEQKYSITPKTFTFKYSFFKNYNDPNGPKESVIHKTPKINQKTHEIALNNISKALFATDKTSRTYRKRASLFTKYSFVYHQHYKVYAIIKT